MLTNPQTPAELAIWRDGTARLAGLMKVLADPTRLQIISLLAALEPNKGYAVKDLIELVGLAQPTISLHMGILRNAGLIRVVKEGTWRIQILDWEGEGTSMLVAYFNSVRAPRKKVKAKRNEV